MHRRQGSVEEQKKKLVDSANIVTESDVAVSKWLRLLIDTHSVLGEAHNMDVIVDTIIELAPTTNWLHVMEDEGFNIPDESALNLMMSIHNRVCIKEPLPTLAVCLSLWKNTEGQNCLMRFVDMCQSLQILSAVLDSAPLPFIIKLAAAASRKDQSLIEKWLHAKSEVYKGRFLEECVNFLKEIMSSTPMEKPHAEIMNMCWGSFPLVVEVCQSHSGELLPSQLLNEHSTVRFGTICNKLEKQVREMTLKYLLQPGSLDIIKDHIGMLLKEQQFSKDLIFKEKQKVSKLKDGVFKYRFGNWHREYLAVHYGPVILILKTLTRSNDDSLKYLKNGLLKYKYLNGDDLVCQVDDIFDRNKAASKRAGLLISEYNDYHTRAHIEVSWIDGAKQEVSKVYGLLSGTVLSELEELENRIFDLNRRVRLLSEEHTQNFHSHCQDLAALAKLYEDIGILWKKLILVTEDAKELCLISKNLRVLLSEKTVNATRFQNTEQNLEQEKRRSKMRQELRDIKLDVEQARKSFKEKIAGLPEASVADEDMGYEQILVDKAMSWRTRLFLNKWNILGEMREQGLDMCAFVSTVVMRESLAKREDARCSMRFGDQWNMPKGYFVKLSEYHLRDLFRAFWEKNKRKGSEKLDVCMERMKDRGVVSEREYDNIDDTHDSEAWGFRSHRISYFEKMVPGNFDEACRKLDDAIVLVGTFGITKGYFSLGPNDVYDAPAKDAILETSAAGNKLTHAVVIVGYGVTPDKVPYYGYQNWYGPDWKGGKDGFGMVTCRSIRQLYSAGL